MSVSGRGGAPRKRASAKKATGANAARGGVPAQERELRAQGKKTMRKLLDAAMVVFDKRGFHAARVDDIVKVAKTSHGTFYLYFANKEDLFRALVGDVAEEMMSLANSLGSIGPDEAGFTELRGWLGRFCDLYEHYGPVIRAWAEADVDESDWGRMGTEMTLEFTSGLARRIAPANSAVDPEIAALAFVAMIERFNYYNLSRDMQYNRDEMLETLTTIVHTGLFGGTRRPSPSRR
jgi:AcrR family transcriptional regulator